MAQALYRQYRPNDLDQVIGQSHITDTLEKAFARGNFAHAYLLTGPRGVGKTSVARIIARRVNQLPANHALDQELDIIEIDAASNRGIDEIRSLREKIATSPSRLKYKVFIIDEVHMLTREAFNALLKTLEEPPAHAIFVLATTESHKLPETIISRTQRHDFRSIGVNDIAQQLAAVAKSETISTQVEALELIAELANGGFRDALSLFDLVASRGQTITVELVSEVSGIGNARQAEAIIQSALVGKFDDALQSLNGQLLAGAEASILTEFLMSRVRQSLINPSQSSFGKLPVAIRIKALQELVDAARQQRTSPIAAVPLELALWRMSESLPQNAAVVDIELTATNKPAFDTKPKSVAKQKIDSHSGAAKLSSDIQNQLSSKPSQEPVEQPTNNSNLPVNDAIITTKALSLIKAKNNSLYAILRSGDPHLEGNVFLVRCRFRFHKERIEESRNRQFIEAVLSKVASQPVELRVEHIDEVVKSDNPADNSAELVASALEILGGEVMDS